MQDHISHYIVQDVGLGIVVLDQAHEVVLWNKFMERYSGFKADQMIGKNLFSMFNELPKEWLSLKLRSVFLLKSFSFISWKQRPYLFKFAHNRPITGSVETMYQDCVFLPLVNAHDGKTYACITVQDMTDVALYEQKVDELREMNITLEQMSYYDSLTSTFNRRYLESQLEAEFNKARRYSKPFTVAMFDLDFFKKVNDTYGHMTGDEVLKGVAKFVTHKLRAADVFGRYGGEEFVLLLPETDIQGGLALAERIREGIERQEMLVGEHKIQITLSMGLVEYRQDMSNHLQMFHESDLALYRSKKEGRNRCTVFVKE